MAKKTTPKAKDTTTAKKKTVKSTAPKKRVVQKKSAVEPAFFEFRVTQQTLYWGIVGIAAITFAVWLFMLDAKVRDLYDQVDSNTYSIDNRVLKPKPAPAEATEETQE